MLGFISRSFVANWLRQDALEREAKGALGVTFTFGGLVTHIRSDSAAQRAGLQEGDFITKIGSTQISHEKALEYSIEDSAAGAELRFFLFRLDSESRSRLPMEIIVTKSITASGHASNPWSTDPSVSEFTSSIGFSAIHGVWISNLADHSPGVDAELWRGDIIYRVDANALTHRWKIRFVIESKPPGEQFKLFFLRKQLENEPWRPFTKELTSTNAVGLFAAQ